jgi:hypothetical protein
MGQGSRRLQLSRLGCELTIAPAKTPLAAQQVIERFART